MPTTSSPRLSRICATCMPIKPAAPVTRTFILFPPNFHAILAVRPSHPIKSGHDINPATRAVSTAALADAAVDSAAAAAARAQGAWLLATYPRTLRVDGHVAQATGVDPCGVGWRGAQPRMGIIMETELWPNLVQASQRAGIQLFLVNARLSERSARGYRKLAALPRATLGGFQAVPAPTHAG